MNTKHMSGKYVVIVADDLGRTSSVNYAIAEAHDKGIVTAASLMAGGEAFQEAVQIAVMRRELSVGLHVTLCDGRSVLSHSRIPDLTSPDGYLERRAAIAWVRYSRRSLLSQIEAEVEAQFDRLEESGIRPTHVDSHHHLHMHPVIFKILCQQASRRGVDWIRLPQESLSVVHSLRSPLRGIMPFIEWAVFGILGEYNLKTAQKYRINVACRVYGLSRTGNVDEKYLLDILSLTRGSFNEIFTHPDVATESGRHELKALTSIKVRNLLTFRGIRLVGYRELSGRALIFNPV